MVNVRLAAAPVLAGVGFGAEEIGAVDVGDVARLKVGFEDGTEIADQQALGTGGERGRRRVRPGFRLRGWRLPRRIRSRRFGWLRFHLR